MQEENIHVPPVLPSYQQQGEQDRVSALAAQLMNELRPQIPAA